jgi:hypothetical protein
MVNKIIIVASVFLAVAVLSLSAGASLTPMSWGFPVMVQGSSLTGLQSQSATASDIESALISFPSGSSSGSLFGSMFPTIGQASSQGSSLSSLGFMNGNQYSYFAYPYISIGGSPIASMGLL